MKFLDPNKLSMPLIKKLEGNKRLIECEPSNAKILMYIFEINVNNVNIITQHCEASNFLFKQFMQGCEYEIKVAACNASGQGRFSDVLYYSEGRSK